MQKHRNRLVPVPFLFPVRRFYAAVFGLEALDGLADEVYDLPVGRAAVVFGYVVELVVHFIINALAKVFFSFRLGKAHSLTSLPLCYPNCKALAK